MQCNAMQCNAMQCNAETGTGTGTGTGTEQGQRQVQDVQSNLSSVNPYSTKSFIQQPLINHP
eukprot:11187453-Lingulodinium_polyedra.AAC.1